MSPAWARGQYNTLRLRLRLTVRNFSLNIKKVQSKLTRKLKRVNKQGKLLFSVTLQFLNCQLASVLTVLLGQWARPVSGPVTGT